MLYIYIIIPNSGWIYILPQSHFKDCSRLMNTIYCH